MLRFLELIDAILAARGMKVAGILLLVCWGPLLLVVMFGERDANPIGLGLLAWLSIPFILGAVVSGVVSGYRRWNATDRPVNPAD